MKKYETLDEIICACMEGECELDDIFDYINAMPHTRESAEEMLDTITCYDVEDAYRALLFDLDDLLSEDELAAVREKYQKIFDLPLPTDEI